MRLPFVCLLAILSLAPLLPAQTNLPASRVVLVQNPDALRNLSVDPVRVKGMVAIGLQTLTGLTNESAAWQQLFSPNDIVGIKVSTASGPAHSTHQAVIEAIADGLRQAGVTLTNIIVFDRDPKHLIEADYHSPIFRSAPVIGGDGWDPEIYIQSRTVGKLIWGDLEFGGAEGLSNRSHLPNLVTRKITKLINVPVLTDHEATGIANCLYNVSLGMADNTRRFEQSGQHGDPAIVQLCALPVVQSKLVLNICDALVASYAGGPTFKPQFSWPYSSLYFSRDPVAIDVLCLDLLEARRLSENLLSLSNRATHVISAGRAGLGQADRDKIELLKTSPTH